MNLLISGMTDEECDALEAEEEEEEKKRRNILADLQHNYDQVKELVAWLTHWLLGDLKDNLDK